MQNLRHLARRLPKAPHLTMDQQLEVVHVVAFAGIGLYFLKQWFISA
jgi:hypothetical protein